MGQPAVQPHIQFFVYLQLLDLLTTVLGLRLGLQEASPFVRQMMHAGPVVGAVLSKVLALGLGAFCIWIGRHHLIRWINYWYATLVAWNLCIMLAVLV